MLMRTHIPTAMQACAARNTLQFFTILLVLCGGPLVDKVFELPWPAARSEACCAFCSVPERSGPLLFFLLDCWCRHLPCAFRRPQIWLECPDGRAAGR
ncbi:MAG: hypothetical protein ACLRZH_01630 [Ruthenibacterium lactatiformans]